MSSRNKANINKIARLSYVIILTILSYILFLSWNSPVEKITYEYLREVKTNHFFITCLKNGWTDPETGSYRPFASKKECSFSGVKSINIDGYEMSVDPDDYNSYVYSPQTEVFRKFNQDPKRGWYYQYSNDNQIAFKKARDITPKIMWGLFFLSIPLIWFTRNFSILIVTLITKGTLKGWNKL